MKNKDQILLENLYNLISEGKKETIDYLQKNGADQDTITLFIKQDATGKPLFPTDQAIIMFNWIKDNPVNLSDIEKDYNNFKKYFPNKNLKDFKNYLNFSEIVHAKVGEKEFENRNKDVGTIDVHGDDKENVIADNEEILILKGDDEHKCVRYGKGYSFCISRPYGGNMYGNYRLSKESTFYFIYFKKVPKEDPKHIMVLDRTRDGWEWTFGENQTQVIEGGWGELIKAHPILAKYEKKFVNKPLTEEEKNYQKKLGSFVKSPKKQKFDEFSYKEKADVLKFGMEIPEDVFDSLDKFLRNEYISVGPAIEQNIFDKLEDKEKERYIKVRKTIINQQDVKSILDREIVKNDPELFEKFAKDDIQYYQDFIKTFNITTENGYYVDKIYFYSKYVPFVAKNLIKAGDIIIHNSIDALLPNLKICGDIYLFEAINIDLKNLIECLEIIIPEAKEINLPKLKKCKIARFNKAKIVNLPNLLECRSFSANNNVQLNLPKLKKCKQINLSSKIANLPNLIECEELDGSLGVEELYLPKLKKCNNIINIFKLKKLVIPKKMMEVLPWYILNRTKTDLEIIHPEDQEVKVESFISSFEDYLLEKYKRMSAGMDVEDIAKKHKVPVSTIKKQIKMGKKVETEHGVNMKKAKRIAMDHLAENPKYYTKLKKAKL